MSPEPARRIELVVLQKTPALGGDEIDRLEDELEDGLADEEVEVHTNPARLDTFAAPGDLAFELVRALDVDAEQPVSVRACARATAASLDPEEVVKQGNDEVVMQVSPARCAHDERDDRETFGRVRAENLDARVRVPARDCAPDEPFLAASDRLDAYGLLELEDESGADRLDDRRRPTLFALLNLRQIDMLGRVDVEDRAATRHRRHAVAEDVAPGN